MAQLKTTTMGNNLKYNRIKITIDVIDILKYGNFNEYDRVYVYSYEHRTLGYITMRNGGLYVYTYELTSTATHIRLVDMIQKVNLYLDRIDYNKIVGQGCPEPDTVLEMYVNDAKVNTKRTTDLKSCNEEGKNSKKHVIDQSLYKLDIDININFNL